jgi:hypothetical protein
MYNVIPKLVLHIIEFPIPSKIPIQYPIPNHQVVLIPIPSFFSIPANDPARHEKRFPQLLKGRLHVRFPIQIPIRFGVRFAA